MIVVIAGHKRSGSTAQYNMVRLVLGEQFRDVYLWGSQTPTKKGINLVKRHAYNEKLYNLADYVFTTERNLEDSKASLKRMTNDDKIDLLSFDMWRRKSLNQSYDDILNNPLKCIKEIIETLKVDVNAEEILNKFNDIKPPQQGQDKITLLFHNHRNEN